MAPEVEPLQPDPVPGRGGEALGGCPAPVWRQHTHVTLGMFENTNFSPFSFPPPRLNLFPLNK